MKRVLLSGGILAAVAAFIVVATGASTAGFAGAIYSSYVGYIVPGNFALLTAIMILAAVVLGGMSNMKGAMLGAAIVVFLPEVFRASQLHQLANAGYLLGIDAAGRRRTLRGALRLRLRCRRLVLRIHCKRWRMRQNHQRSGKKRTPYE